MEKSTVKKIAFWIGLIFHLIVILGFLYYNYWCIDDELLDIIQEKDITLFAILSLFGSGIMIYGMFTPLIEDVKKDSIIACVIGTLIWLYLIINMFSAKRYDSFYLNWFLLFISATALIIFAMKNMIKRN